MESLDLEFLTCIFTCCNYTNCAKKEISSRFCLFRQRLSLMKLGNLLWSSESGTYIVFCIRSIECFYRTPWLFTQRRTSALLRYLKALLSLPLLWKPRHLTLTYIKETNLQYIATPILGALNMSLQILVLNIFPQTATTLMFLSLSALQSSLPIWTPTVSLILYIIFFFSFCLIQYL